MPNVAGARRCFVSVSQPIDYFMFICFLSDERSIALVRRFIESGRENASERAQRTIRVTRNVRGVPAGVSNAVPSAAPFD